MAMPSSTVRLFMTGDVVLARGIDQMLAHSCDPVLYEDYVKDATEYVELAVRANGPLPAHRDVGYIWGDALGTLRNMKPDCKIVNLETAVTTCRDYWKGKGIHYRTHPKNVEVLQCAGIDVVCLSNNHVLDWGREGLLETLETLEQAGIGYTGAGRNLGEAQKPAFVALANLNLDGCEESTCCAKNKIAIFGLGHVSSGIPHSWQATDSRSGVNLIDFDNARQLKDLAARVAAARIDGAALVVVSIHWGANWDWDLEVDQEEFAHRLIDEADVDVIHGHSSHHVKGVEVYGGKLVLWGAGDFISDYEGIQNVSSGKFRDDLSFMYFADFNIVDRKLKQLVLVPMRLKHFRVSRAIGDDSQWLFSAMKRECCKWNGELAKLDDGNFQLIFDM